MGKYDDWQRGETEALLNIVGGSVVARAVFRGEKRIVVEDVVRQQPPAKPTLVGTLVKTLVLKPYGAKSVADAVKQGKYDGSDSDIPELFAEDDYFLVREVRIELWQYNRNPESEEVVEWGKANGKKPINPNHIYGIGIQHSAVQCNNPVVALGSVRSGYVLYLSGSSGWRALLRSSFAGACSRGCLFGFICE